MELVGFEAFTLSFLMWISLAGENLTLFFYRAFR